VTQAASNWSCPEQSELLQRFPRGSPPVISEFCFQSCKLFLRRCGSHHNHAVGRLDVSLPTLNIDLASSRRSIQYIESLVFPFLTRE
jgi:hypothetical protein